MKEITRLTIPLPGALHALLVKRARAARRTLTAEILLTLDTTTTTTTTTTKPTR